MKVAEKEKERLLKSKISRLYELMNLFDQRFRVELLSFIWYGKTKVGWKNLRGWAGKTRFFFAMKIQDTSYGISIPTKIVQKKFGMKIP